MPTPRQEALQYQALSNALHTHRIVRVYQTAMDRLPTLEKVVWRLGADRPDVTKISRRDDQTGEGLIELRR